MVRDPLLRSQGTCSSIPVNERRTVNAVSSWFVREKAKDRE